MGTADLLAWLASLAPGERDRAIEARLGIADPVATTPPGEHLVGYHASGVAPIVRALIEAPVTESDVLVDIGAGLGKVVLLARLLTGATARGIELQPALAARARAAAATLGVDVAFTTGDACDADLGDGTVFFLYVPFTGPVLASLLAGLRCIAEERAIVVCTLGLDLEREAPWLERRPIDAFWLGVYDSVIPGARARAHHQRARALGEAADVIAFERAARPG